MAALRYQEDAPVLLVMQRVAVAFLIALETGMRAGEIRNCIVEGKVAKLRDRVRICDATKNGDEREVPLSPRARELFAKVEGKVSARAMGSVFIEARLTACAKLAQKLKPTDLAKMLGHRDLKNTMVYYNPRAEDLADLLG